MSEVNVLSGDMKLNKMVKKQFSGGNGMIESEDFHAFLADL